MCYMGELTNSSYGGGAEGVAQNNFKNLVNHEFYHLQQYIIQLFLEFLKKIHDFLHGYHFNQCLTTYKLLLKNWILEFDDFISEKYLFAVKIFKMLCKKSWVLKKCVYIFKVIINLINKYIIIHSIVVL